MVINRERSIRTRVRHLSKTIIRKVACSVIGRTTEIVKQSDNGRKLHLKLSNPKGVWELGMLHTRYPYFNTDDSKQRDD